MGVKTRSLPGGHIENTLDGKLSRPDGTFHPAGEKIEIVPGQNQTPLRILMAMYAGVSL